jgi:methylenetetrahydrofolate dehydrogenase (NADP+) / methenyltetrahydrofolate cyclohydrolase
MLLLSKNIVEEIKERQSREAEDVRARLRVTPKLAIIVTTDDPVIGTYVRMKKKYGADLGIDVDIHRVEQSTVPGLLKKLNVDPKVNGIIVQLPLERPDETDEITAIVAPEKDVDALGSQEFFEPATPMAILLLLSGYGIDLPGKKVVLVGRGKLVGAPLERMLKRDGIDVEVATRTKGNLDAEAPKADVIITATGVPAVLKPEMVKPGAVVVDAGVASEGGKTVGDVAPEMFDRDDISVTPTKGGVGPLTVCALFENVLRAARQQLG